MSSGFKKKSMKIYFSPSEESIRDMYNFTSRSGEKTGVYSNFQEQLITQGTIAKKYISIKLSTPPSVFKLPELRSIQVPKLLIIGDEEVLYEDISSVLEYAVNAGFEISKIENASHDLLYAQPDKIADTIMLF